MFGANVLENELLVLFGLCTVRGLCVSVVVTAYIIADGDRAAVVF